MLYRILDKPLVYRVTQYILSPGGEARLNSVIAETTSSLPQPTTVLDVGCGPRSMIGAKFGLDVSESYIAVFPGLGVVGSATALPFPTQAFDAVVCFGLLHHLDTERAYSALKEMKRVARYWALITDPVLPDFKAHPWALTVRKLDRGGQVRTESEASRILEGWNVRRFKYTSTGLEGLIAYFRNP